MQELFTRLLVISAITACLLSAFLTLTSGQFEPPLAAAAPPVKPEVQAGTADRIAYLNASAAYNAAMNNSREAITAYRSKNPARYLLTILILLAYFAGIFYPPRPTPFGIALALGGAVGLLLLTAALLLPANLPLFIGLLVVECLLMVPPVYLLLFRFDR